MEQVWEKTSPSKVGAANKNGPLIPEPWAVKFIIIVVNFPITRWHKRAAAQRVGIQAFKSIMTERKAKRLQC